MLFNLKVVALLILPTSTLAAVSWTLSSTTLNQSSFEVQPYVSNGYIGQRIPVEGHGYKEFTPINVTAMDGTNGWPLFDPRFTAAMVSGFYDQQDNTTGTNFVGHLKMRN
jgi:trehalose/maltose hydrolase-like predicted phosphorylase